MAAFFAVTLFTSAALLFWVQPMVAKMLLPLLGGTPEVWNTCMVFFQALLLAGYAYAHVLATRCPLTTQKIIHLSLMLGTCFVLPIGLSAQSAPWNTNPFFWLLCALLSMVALPFFTVSCSAPLLQGWFRHTRHSAARDPYFLYAASNLGSVAGLMAYPVLLEPELRLHEQARLWTLVYVLLVSLFAGCALLTRNRPQPANPVVTPASSDIPRLPQSQSATAPVNWRRRLAWMFWAFIPSSLMLGVTSYLTTDIASVPLLWTVPLAIYLLTFTLAFSRRQIIPRPWLTRGLPICAVAILFVMLVKSNEFIGLQIGIHLLFFFCAALAWHTRLANDRPHNRHLTDFYFCLAAGGVLGGLFNALLAPLLFRTIVEYPLTIALACIRWPDNPQETATTHPIRLNLLWPAGVGMLALALALVVRRSAFNPHLQTMAVFGVPLVLCYLLSKQKASLSFALAVGAVLAVNHFHAASEGRTLFTERDFFGALRVSLDPDSRIVRLYDGTTIHGMQFLDPKRRTEPLAYYDRAGPCGQAMTALDRRTGITNVAVIGLGSGAMACYARTNQHWTFYEIDPAVLRLARESPYFTYIRQATNVAMKFKLGDARLRLREAAPGQFDLLACDAFGSDAPPLHLIDREAMKLYLSKLSAHGVLLFHISSRYLDFRPVIANLAACFHLHALVGRQSELSEAMLREGRLPSTWVAVARRLEDLGSLASDPRWHPLPPAPSMKVWTDDYSDILAIFQWR